MKTAHFDVDKEIKKYLTGLLFTFSLTSENLKKISDRKNIKIITIKSQSVITNKILAYFPNLELIITRTVGVDHIDLEACKKRNINIKNIPDYGASNIAEHALALLTNGSRNIVQANKEVHTGKFDYRNFLGISFKNKTLGVIGTGKIGLELIKLMQNFGLNIICYDIFKNEKASKDLNFKYVELDNLLKNSDFISIHVPLFPSTNHLIGEKEIKLIKDNVVLVNTSRGEIIDTKSLTKNIKKFKAVCLDVIEGEKTFNKTNPLLKYNNVVITPHIGFYTDDSVKNIGQITKKYINDYLIK
jgi:lactate dehydrogenase-like 2-hydroxyacid dehydrogenase